MSGQRVRPACAREAQTLADGAGQHRSGHLLRSTPALDRLARDCVCPGGRRQMDLRCAPVSKRLSRGRGVRSCFLGDAGIGKTRLTTELTPYAPSTGMRALLGRLSGQRRRPAILALGALVRT